MKTVLITGIGRGIGKALADTFMAEGYFVIGTTAKTKIRSTAPNLKVLELDLASSDSVKACADAVKASGMKIDVLVNNAGILIDDGETDLDPRKLRETLDVNLIGTAEFTEKIIPYMNKAGQIVFVSSAAGSIADMDEFIDSSLPINYPAYKISKAALNMYMRTLAARMQPKGMTVSSVHPGWVQTDMGGDEAPVAPEEAARQIYKLATTDHETGQFWFKGEKYAW